MIFTECIARIDLAFLLDSSSSIERYGVGNFRRLVNFIRDITISFRVSRKDTRVALVLYGTRPRKFFGFRRYTNNGALFNKFNKAVPYARSGTRTGRALRYLWRQVFRRPSRKKATKVIVVITDGKSLDNVYR